jgi:probable rRNA maturation factor
MPARPSRTVTRRARLAVDVALAGVRATVSRTELRELAAGVLRSEGVRDAYLSIVFVTPRAIARLNRLHLGHRGPTDVITFRLRPPPGGGAAAAVVGDICICSAVAARNARRFGVSMREEIKRLVVHGTLHVAGLDHPEGAARTESPMWIRQERFLRRWQKTRTRA